MLDSGASTNVMTLKVMNQLGLKTTCPYRNVCAMESREIKVCGFIKDLHVKLAAYPNISLLMDVVVIDVLDPWGMLLSRKWGKALEVVFRWTYLMPPYPHVKVPMSHYTGSHL
jgi:hypothetical protein